MVPIPTTYLVHVRLQHIYGDRLTTCNPRRTSWGSTTPTYKPQPWHVRAWSKGSGRSTVGERRREANCRQPKHGDLAL
eukprot:2087569-Amphidinium_carterae.1